MHLFSECRHAPFLGSMRNVGMHLFSPFLGTFSGAPFLPWCLATRVREATAAVAQSLDLVSKQLLWA
jgi:hypothetical protein